MPNGVNAEDSDDAEIRPAKTRKLPTNTTVAGNEDESDSVADRIVNVPEPTQAMPVVNLDEIRTRQAANEKESKALTRVKRRPKQSALSRLAVKTFINAVADLSGIHPSRKANGIEEPPLKRARNRPSVDQDLVPSSKPTSPQQRKSPRKSIMSPPDAEPSSAKGKGKQDDSSSTGERPRRNSGNVLDLTFDPPSSPIRTKWPVKKDGKRHEKDVGFELFERVQSG
jgi:hypothetical protein